MNGLKTLEESLSMAIQEAAKDKVFLAQLGRDVTDEVFDAWVKSAKANDIDVVEAVKYNDNTIKVTFKGKSSDLKNVWQTQKVQDYAKLVGKQHVDNPKDMTYKNIRKG